MTPDDRSMKQSETGGVSVGTTFFERQLSQLLIQAQEAGFTAAETVDFLAINVVGIDFDEWVERRDVGDVVVKDHVREASHKANSWAGNGNHDH